MKLNHALVLTAALILTPLLRAGDLPAPLPEFLDQQQLAKWNAEQAAAATTASANEPSNQFYTGKPYVADAGGYVYKYRTYNPGLSRWTSADPSGFPDGVNNCAYAPVPTIALDNDGLLTVSVSGTNPPASITTSGHTISYDTITGINAATFSFTGFTVTTGTLSGTLNVNIPSASPFNNGSVAGYGDSNPVEGSYTGSGDFDWVQIITTNVPGSGTVISTSGSETTYFDNHSDTFVPFYGNSTDKKTGNNPWETDNPQRSFSGTSINWTADMYLVSVVGSNITVYGGYTWGFSME
ncbi:MAG: hypothetical protein LV481_14855 [Methylacidiphilales bacterium]|nr:hypothetical protein [Candidatus Methylacidiphilales bacterium]